jgi:hypothetical protein
MDANEKVNVESFVRKVLIDWRKHFFAQVIAALSLSMFTERLSFEIESNSHSFIY